MNEYDTNNKIKSIKEICYEAISECILIEKGKDDIESDFDIESGYDFYHRIYNKEGSLLEETILHDGINKYKTTYFDNSGNILEERYFKDDGTLRNKTIYIYENGHLTEEKVVYEDGTGYTSHIYVRNKKGERIALRIFNSDGIEYGYIKYDYDDRGNILLLERYHEGKLTESHQRKYDELGNIVYFSETGTGYYSEENCGDICYYKYDDGKVVEEDYFTLKGQLFRKKTYKYNEIGNLIQVKMYDYESHGERLIEESFDNDGKILEKIHYCPDEIARTLHKHYFYDDKNNLIKEIEDVINVTRTFQYQYDDKGNWIRKTEFCDDEPKFISEREIIYYDSTEVIKSIKEDRFHAVKKYVGEIIKGKRKRQFSGGGDTLTIYDMQGNKSEVTWYNSDERVKYKKSFKYDVENRKINEIGINKFDNIDYSIDFKYDDNGNLIEEYCSNFNEDSTKDSKTYVYDLWGNRTEICIYSFYDDTLRHKIENTYDYKNNIIDSTVYELGIYKYQRIYKYDQNNFLIEEERINNEGNIIEKTTYKYDDKGNQIELENFFSNEKLVRYYDDKRMVREVKSYNSKGIVERTTNFHYRYDEKGNWVEKIITIDNIPSYIEEREIEYF